MSPEGRGTQTGTKTWCKDNNLRLNTRKKKELILDFREYSADPLPLCINDDCMERIHSSAYISNVCTQSVWEAVGAFL